MPVQIRVSDTQGATLDARARRYLVTAASEQARTDLEMLYGLLEVEARVIPWTVDEAIVIAHAQGGSLMTPALGQILWTQVSDYLGIEDDLVAVPKHESDDLVVDAAQILAKLERLTITQDLAVRECLSRWWADKRAATAEGFRAVGLVIDDFTAVR